MKIGKFCLNADSEVKILTYKEIFKYHKSFANNIREIAPEGIDAGSTTTSSLKIHSYILTHRNTTSGINFTMLQRSDFHFKYLFI